MADRIAAYHDEVATALAAQGSPHYGAASPPTAGPRCSTSA